MKKKVFAGAGLALALLVSVVPMKASAEEVTLSTQEMQAGEVEPQAFPAVIGGALAAARATNPVVRAAQAAAAVVGAAALGFAEQFGSNAADRVNGGDSSVQSTYTVSEALLD